MPGSPPAGFSTPDKQMADRLLTTMLKTETEERARITAERQRALSQSLTDVARVDLLQQFTVALTPEVDRRRKAAAAREVFPIVQAVDQSREASSNRADELRAELTALNVHMMK